MSLHFASGEYGVSTSARAAYSGQNLTIAIWIKGDPASNAATGSVIAAAADVNNPGIAGLVLGSGNWFNTGDSIFAYTCGDFWGYQAIVNSNGAGGEDDTWTLWTFRSTTDFATTASHQLWKNGSQHGSTNTDFRRRYAGSNLKAGVMCDPADPTDTAFHSNGKTLAHFAIWAGYRSDAEIVALAAGDNPMTVAPDELLDYWDLEVDGRNLVDPLNVLIITGTPDEDADSPPVDDPPGGGSTPTSITPTAGSLTIAGQPVTVNAVRVISVGAGSISIAGHGPALAQARAVSPAAGSVSIAGQAVGTNLARAVAVGAGALSVAGQAVELLTGRVMEVGSGALSIAGQALAFARARGINIAVGALSVAGHAVTLARDRAIEVGAGALSIAGQSVDLLRNFRIAVTAGAVSIAGQAATVTKTLVIEPAAGAISIAGQAVRMGGEAAKRIIRAVMRAIMRPIMRDMTDLH